MAKQKGNTINGSVPVESAVLEADAPTPAVVVVEGPADAPVREIDPQALQQLGAKFKSLFDRYASERIPAEQRWLKNLRQLMGIYDPEVLRQLEGNRSRAYPRLTRMKCISMLSRIMNLMFPGNEDNWELSASPSPSMSPDDVEKAVTDMMATIQGEGGQPPPITQELVDAAVRDLANRQAAGLALLVKDQLNEIGGDQTLDWITLNRKVCQSGINFGIGVLEGPFIRTVQTSGWVRAENGFQPETRTEYKPQYSFLPCWDFYPDMSSRELPGEGYFVRKVLGRSALRKLGNRPDFFADQVKFAIRTYVGGNYKAKGWENELKSMGTAINSESSSNQSSGREKFEIIVWKGPVSAQTLKEVGAEVPDEMLADDIEAELWMVENTIIKAEINAWRKLGLDVKQVHIFSFDEDDTSPISQGLPYVVRDSQLSICAATRMTLDNASVTCGPNLEVNTALCRLDQDLTSVQPYKIWYRDDEGISSQYPAVRRIEIDGHLGDLQGLVKMFLDFAEMETFIGPSTGGDMTKVPSEASRTVGGASMLRSDAALPFKDIVRNYDSFTQSAILSLVHFNKVYNPDQAPKGDYNVIARGATSLIAKEMRGIQIDMLSQTMTEEERDHIDERKFVEAKFASRDLQGMLVTPDEAARRKANRAQVAAGQADLAKRASEAQIRETLAGAFKDISQGQKNAGAADKTAVETALAMAEGPDDGANDQGAGAGGGGAAA